MKQIKKILITLIKHLDIASAIAIKLTRLTGKSKEPIHPKHLIDHKMWFSSYLKKNDRILDFGCGNGFNLIGIGKLVKNGVGLDINPASIKIANAQAKKKKFKNLIFTVGNCNNSLPFSNKSFDGAIASDILEHLNNPKFAIRELKRILKNRGLLFLVTDNPNTSWKKLQKSVGVQHYADPDHRYEYPKKEIIDLLKKNGFKITFFDTITYDTPFKGLIDLSGGISISVYKKLRNWREEKVKKFPSETTGYRIVAQKL